MGFITTHPNLFVVCVIWDSIQSHHKMLHSPEFGSALHALMPICDEAPEFKNFKITDAKELKKVLEMPVTQMSCASIKKDQAAAFIKEYNNAWNKYVKQYCNCHTIMYSYEDPYSPGDVLIRFLFYAILGWKTEQEHYDVMKMEPYGPFRDAFKDYLAGLTIYHAEIKKVHGDWKA